jgi:EAL domain-containing protein (putative c-di-GMP-specific phosphodiesterase class I)
VPRILLLDDDPDIRRDYARVLRSLGEVVTSSDGHEAIEQILSGPVDVILSDITMPRMTGLEFLRNVRQHDADVPVILMTGAPELAGAMEAVEHGAFRYLVKPVAIDELRETVRRAMRLGEVARLKREALAIINVEGRSLGDRATLEARYASGLARLWTAYQPIVCFSDKTVFAYEALVRSDELLLQTPSDLLDAAERLGRMNDLGRAVRRSAAAVSNARPDLTLFVNLHPQDLEDPELFASEGALTAMAPRIVLEITERASIEGVRGVTKKVARLKALGFRIAVDDLGAGYAGLNSFVHLEPDFVKLDMALVRGVDQSQRKQRVIHALLHLCRDELGMKVICEGIETKAERDTLIELGADLLQGYFFARPAPAFPEPTW